MMKLCERRNRAEERLWNWRAEQGGVVAKRIVQEKAKEAFREEGFHNFKVSFLFLCILFCSVPFRAFSLFPLSIFVYKLQRECTFRPLFCRFPFVVSKDEKGTFFNFFVIS